MRNTMPEMVEAVKAHATEHYEDGGWDVVIECYDDEMIAQLLVEPDSIYRKGRTLTYGPARTNNGAIRKVKSLVVDIMADRQADARNSAF